LIVEIVASYDRTRDKIDFYQAIGARELLIVDRDPWQLELLRLAKGKLLAVAGSTTAHDNAIISDVVPLTFRLTEADDRPEIVVSHVQDGRRWIV
jgi:hypothetical protein